MHHVYNARQLTPPVAFLHLAVDQARRYLPSAYVSPSTSLFPPCPKMSREGIKVEIEPVTRKERQAERRPLPAVGHGSRHELRFACEDPDAGQVGFSYAARWPTT